MSTGEEAPISQEFYNPALAEAVRDLDLALHEWLIIANELSQDILNLERYLRGKKLGGDFKYQCNEADDDGIIYSLEWRREHSGQKECRIMLSMCLADGTVVSEILLQTKIGVRARFVPLLPELVKEISRSLEKDFNG